MGLPDRVVKITGTPDQLLRAVALLLTKLVESPNYTRFTTSNVSYGPPLAPVRPCLPCRLPYKTWSLALNLHLVLPKKCAAVVCMAVSMQHCVQACLARRRLLSTPTDAALHSDVHQHICFKLSAGGPWAVGALSRPALMWCASLYG